MLWILIPNYIIHYAVLMDISANCVRFEVSHSTIYCGSCCLLPTAQELNEESMVTVFSEVRMCAPENWREIGVQLGLKLRGQLSAAMFFKGWIERGSNHKPSWEKLAVAFSNINGYLIATAKARDKARTYEV